MRQIVVSFALVVGRQRGVDPVLDVCISQGLRWRAGFRTPEAELIEALASKRHWRGCPLPARGLWRGRNFMQPWCANGPDTFQKEGY